VALTDQTVALTDQTVARQSEEFLNLFIFAPDKLLHCNVNLSFYLIFILVPNYVNIVRIELDAITFHRLIRIIKYFIPVQFVF